MGGAQFLGQIRCAHDQAIRGVGDGGGGKDPFRGLDHAPDLHHRGGTGDRVAGRPDRRHVLDLGQQHAIGTGSADGGQIVEDPWRVGAVGTDEYLALPIAAGPDGIADLVAGRLLGVRGNRILKVEDQGVGGQGFRFFEGAGVRARHVECASARSSFDGHESSPR